MVLSIWTLLLGTASLVAAHPVAEKRAVTELNQAAFEEAQQRDDTATRVFSSVPIKASSPMEWRYRSSVNGTIRHLPGSVYSLIRFLGISEQT